MIESYNKNRRDVRWVGREGMWPRLPAVDHKSDGRSRFITNLFAAWGAIWILGLLFSLSLACGAIYIALHFIAKWW